MLTQADDTVEERSSASENENIQENDMDDKNADEESLQLSVPTSQESEVPLPNDPAGAESLAGGADPGAQEERKRADDAHTEDMEVAQSKAAPNMGNLMPACSQDMVEVHTP